MKRIVCLLLTLAVVLSCLPMAALALETESVAVETEAPAETLPEAVFTGSVEGTCLKSSDFLHTLSGISAYSLDSNGNPVLAGGNYASWYDRLGNKPAYAENFHLWLEEATDNDGLEDLLISVENAALNEFGYAHTVTSFDEMLYVDLPYDVDEDTLVDTCSDLVGEKMGQNLAEASAYVMAVYNAFDRDHPEVFWLNGEHMAATPSTSFTIMYGSSGWEVSFVQEVCFVLQTENFDVRADKYATSAAIQAGIARRDSAVNNILAGIPAAANTYDKVVYLNDWLTGNNCYNSSANLNTIGVDCRKCLSGLEGQTGTNGPVCEGYARAFKVLCDKLGIGCVLVDGDANNGSGTEAHMWNYVRMDNGKWYAVDVTWNDPVVSGVSSAVSGYECQDYLLVGAYTIVDDMPFNNSHPVSNTVSEGGVSFTNGPVLAAEKYGTDVPCQHSYDAPVFTWTDYEACTAAFRCTDCGDTQTVACSITSETTPATATEDGQRVYTATAPFGSDEFYDTQTEVLPATGVQDGLIDYGTLADGKCSWELDTNGKLTISGNGDMYACQMQTQVPWLAYADRIKTVVIEEGVTSVGPYSFYECLNLTEVSIPSTVKQIHQDAFYWCRSLTQVTIPDAVSSIGMRAFYNCDGLESIDLGEGVQILGNTAFDMCRSLTEITIPASVVAIDSYCFRSCENLSKVTFQGNAPTFSGQVFSGVGIFPSDTLTCCYPAGNATWNESVMQNYGGNIDWVAVDENGNVEEPDPSGTCGSTMNWTLDLDTGVLTISGTGFMNNVDSMIYAPWHSYKEQIKKVVIEEGVESIGKCMLSGLPNMTEVELPDSLRIIMGAAFEMSTGLASIDLSGLEAVENAAFNGCTGLTEVTIPDGIELRGITGVGIGDRGIFSNCTNLRKVTVGNFTDSGANLFKNCTSLSEVTLQEGMEFLSGYMFSGCTALTEITIPNGTDIGGGAFSGCTALNAVNFGTSVGLVGEKAFEGCTSLKRIDFPWVVGDLYDSVFYLSGVDTLYFKGDAPSFSRHTLNNLKVTIYYPSGNSTWNDKVNGHFGANIDTWVPYTVDHTHSYGSWTTVTASTCAVKGEEERQCAVCGAVEIRELALLEHSYSETVTAPTCEAEGYTTYTCIVCDYGYMDDFVAATGIHTYSSITDTTCDVCGTVREVGDTLELPFSETEWEVLKLTNEQREAAGLQPLTGYALLQQAGNIRAGEVERVFSHTRPDGTSCFTVLDELGIFYWSAGENIAWGYPSAQSVVNGWMNSTGHRENILNSGFGHMTVGNVNTSWVQMFTDATTYSGIQVFLPEALSVDPGTTIDELDLVAVLSNSISSECFLPLRDSHCQGFAPDQPGDQTVTVSVLDVSCTFSIHVHDWQAGGCGAAKACTLCGETVGTPGDHSFGAWTVAQEPTCTEKGVERRDCGNCDHYETREIAATGHTEVTDAAVAPTCTDTGLTEGKHCEACGVVLTAQETVAATGHDFGNWTVTQAAACTEKGTERRDCGNCDHYETREIAATGHTEVTDAAVAPTCTAEGKTEGKHCSVCNAVLTAQETVPATGHSWDNGVVTTWPTETTEGIRTYTCTVCSETKTEPIPVLDPIQGSDSEKQLMRVKAVYADGETKEYSFAYDDRGRIVSSLLTESQDSGAPKEYAYSYDEQNRLITVQVVGDHWSAGLPRAEYYYDQNGMLTRSVVREGGAVEYTYQYDEQGRLVQKEMIADGSTAISSYTYSADGLEAQAVTYTTYEYGGPTESYNYYTYDYRGRLLTDCLDTDYFDSFAQYNYEYIPFVYEVLEEGSFSSHRFYLADIMGNHIWSLYSGEVASLESDTDGYLSRITNSEGTVFEFYYHAHDYNSVVTAPTCTEKGYTLHTCTCGDSYTDSEVPAAGHTEVTDAAVAPTCTAEGKTEGKHCSVCNTVLTAQETVPATGHSWDNGVVTTQPTATAPGVKTYTCTACDETKTEAIPATGETFILGDANGDGRVNFKDAILVLQFASGRVTEENLNVTAADANGDGRHNFKDAIQMLKIASGRA